MASPDRYPSSAVPHPLVVALHSSPERLSDLRLSQQQPGERTIGCLARPSHPPNFVAILVLISTYLASTPATSAVRAESRSTTGAPGGTTSRHVEVGVQA